MKNIRKIIVLLILLSNFQITGNTYAQSNEEYKEIQFDSQIESQLFPGWKGEGEKGNDKEAISGIIGENDDGKRLFQYIPRITDIILKFIAPVIVALVIFAGIRFIYAGSDEEEITKSKNFFVYAVIGLMFIVLSYSIMKAVYFLLSNG